MKVPVSPHPLQFLLFSVGILGGGKWYLSVIFIFISLISEDVEHIFMCFLSIHVSSLMKCMLNFDIDKLLLSVEAAPIYISISTPESSIFNSMPIHMLKPH